MPDFKTFINNRPELQELDADEQLSEYESYIAMVLEAVTE